jgi:lipocalin
VERAEIIAQRYEGKWREQKLLPKGMKESGESRNHCQRYEGKWREQKSLPKCMKESGESRNHCPNV